jgi:hypothetical protein
MTCDAGRPELLSWDVGRPLVTAVVPDARERCGPNVAPAAGPSDSSSPFLLSVTRVGGLRGQA